ncbi:hypothetical protein FS842_000958 [Serendipita sp. 407]|nr:hypothetical protein FS842_000958 [Serendipita sp. 407]
MPIGTTKLRDGRCIPNLAFGSGSALRGKDAYESVAAALRTGFRHIDTAQLYHNEDSVGMAIKEWLDGDLGYESRGSEKHVIGNSPTFGLSSNKREDLWVTTKYGGGDQGPYEELKNSLKRLQLEYVDLYLIHNPKLIHGDLVDIWRGMEQAKKDGIAKSIGVSNFDAKQLSDIVKIAKEVPVINQMNLHPYIYQSSLDTLKFCNENRIIVEAYGSLYPITQYPDGPVTAALIEPQRRLNATAAQVLFLWVRAKGAVIVTTTNRSERLVEYLALGKLGPLYQAEVNAIDAAGAIPSSDIESNVWLVTKIDPTIPHLRHILKYRRFISCIFIFQATALTYFVYIRNLRSASPNWETMVCAGSVTIFFIASILLTLIRRRATARIVGAGANV